MRKRRILANKMTIMVCAVLIAVSAFFYAPMEVDAYSGSSSIDVSFQHYTNQINFEFSNAPIGTGFDSDVYYRITFNPNLEFRFSQKVLLRNLYFRSDYIDYYLGNVDDIYTITDGKYISKVDRSIGVIMKGSSINRSSGTIKGRILTGNSSGVFDYDYSYNPVLISAVPLTGEESESYQQGYNAGYSVGEAAGESNGYSSGYSDGYEAGEQSGYDSGFQAGTDSVDTQSYYDAGYQAGYDAGYSSGYDTGYDTGYDAGWSAYEEQMDKWGADTSEYPLFLSSGEKSEGMFSISVKTSYPFHYATFSEWTSNTEYNPNHTYRFDIDLTPLSYHEGSDDVYFLEEDIFYFNIGGIKYKISDFKNSSVNRFFIPGDRMSTAYSFSWEPYCAMMGDVMTSSSPYCYYDLSFQIYDMGPSGDTQNHIANQTDQLTNGYDDSKGNTVNSDLSTGLNEYETAENSLFATATTGMKDFTFFDFESVPAMITGMSFIGSIMGSWFNQAGGASGVGIVLSILFSVILVAMVLGLYRWYQSRGGKN